jgi:hypothetical protein
MSADSHPRPGFVCLCCGTALLGLSAARLATGHDPAPGRLGVELTHVTFGTGLILWGWSRLRRARAARPDRTWCQFLYDDLILLGIIVTLLTGLVAMTPEQRDALGKSFLKLAELYSMVRGPH